MRQRSMKGWVSAAVIVVLVCASAPLALADTDTPSVARSILLPGSGQAHQGHYAKAVVFAGSAIVSGAGLLLSQVHYNQAVVRYNDLRDVYLGYEGRAAGGEVIAYSDILQTREDMQEEYDKAGNRKKWRDMFLGAFLVTYTVNLVDILLSDPDTGEKPAAAEPAVGMELRGNDIVVYKSFRF